MLADDITRQLNKKGRGSGSREELYEESASLFSPPHPKRDPPILPPPSTSTASAAPDAPAEHESPRPRKGYLAVLACHFRARMGDLPGGRGEGHLGSMAKTRAGFFLVSFHLGWNGE